MSDWVEHVRKYALENKISYKQALKEAAPTYKKEETKPKKESSSINVAL